jgi:phosphonopyruvate decarboxylase
MLDTSWFFGELKKLGISFFSGVPDSLLQDFCLYISNNVPLENHIIAANEGNAIALAAGYHLATGQTGLVYMQNSGLGNAVNPLTSLMDPAVYSLPVLLLIGWRGEPGVHDEPQHVKQGLITTDLLSALDIPYEILPVVPEIAQEVLEHVKKILTEEKRPYALIVRKGTFDRYRTIKTNNTVGESVLSREEAVQITADNMRPSDIVVSTTGMISRELYEYRTITKKTMTGQDFLTVGSMGHASQIALGIALQKPHRTVYCLDGDGAFLMHMGGASIIGTLPVNNFKHIIFNNGAHDSVGGQPTAAFGIQLTEIARASGYKEARRVAEKDQLEISLQWLRDIKGPALLEVIVKKGARSDLGRPKETPQQNKLLFMKHCQS